MNDFWRGFEKRAEEGDHPLINTRYVKLKLKQRAKEDWDLIRKRALKSALITGGGASLIAGLAHALGKGKKSEKAWKAVKTIAKVAPAGALAGGLLGTAHGMGDIHSRNKTEAEMHAAMGVM